MSGVKNEMRLLKKEYLGWFNMGMGNVEGKVTPVISLLGD